MGLRRKIK